MKILIRSLLVALIFITSICAKAQVDSTTTIILLRHAEKDTCCGKDPQLSTAGKARAERLPVIFKDLKPDLMYTTPYIRTRQTLAPWAQQTKVEIREYDPNDLQTFADQLRSMKGKTIVVAGHSNTTAMLVNLLIKTTKYNALDDSDYSTLWIVKVKDGIITEKTLKY